MKEIEYYIKSNSKLMEECKEALKYAKNEEEKERLNMFIVRYDYYIKGLKDAKKYIENEKKEEEV